MCIFYKMVKIGGFFFHKGCHDYLKYTLNSCVNNFNYDFYLIGDEHNKTIKGLENNGYTYHDMRNYGTSVKRFQRLFYEKPVTVNNLNYELTCYERWIYIRNFMAFHDIDVAVCFDSDVYMTNNFSNLNIDLENMSDEHYYIYGNGLMLCPHITIMPFKVLTKFIDFMFYVFEKSLDHMKQWANKLYNDKVHNLQNHISDMCLLGDFSANHYNNELVPFTKMEGLENFKQINIVAYGYEHDIYINYNIDELLENNNTNIDALNIFKKNNNIYIDRDNKIMLVLLFHFQGNSKKYVEGFDKFIKTSVSE